jgi:hypothetical protein
MTEETGARKGGSTPGGSEPETRLSFSVTICRARLMSCPQSNSTHDHRDADGRRRSHPADTGRAVERRFDRKRHQRFDLERIHARRFDEDRDDGP